MWHLCRSAAGGRADTWFVCCVLQLYLTATHLCIVMEYAAGGELFDRIVKAGRFSEDEARYFFQQLICGVDYCHQSVSAGPRGMGLTDCIHKRACRIIPWGLGLFWDMFRVIVHVDCDGAYVCA